MFNDCKVRWANRLVLGILGEVAQLKGLKKAEVVKTFSRGKDAKVTAAFWDVLAEKAGVETFGVLFSGVNYCEACNKFHLNELDPDRTKQHLSEYMKTLPK
jgi:hypothetical protein